MKEKIFQLIKKVSQAAIPFTVEIPESVNFGHYSTNVALRLAKTAGLKPMELAETIASRLKKANQEGFFEKIEAAPPGFINFWLPPFIFQEELKKIISQPERYGENSSGKDKKARVEYVSANPTGPIHIGNARGGPLGEVLCRILEANGYRVLREYLHNDAGTQVEKLGETLWYWYERLRGQETVFPEGGYGGEYPHEVAKSAFQKLGSDLKREHLEPLVDFGLNYIFSENIKTLSRLGIVFDLIVEERELIRSGKTASAIEAVKKSGATLNKDGALWFAPGDEFLSDREAVVVRSSGQPTYFASDIAYHREKFTSGYDLVIDIFGSNHHGHVPKLAALTKIFGFEPQNFKVILYQYVRVKRGEVAVKMSKRAGTYVTAREVLDEVGADNMIFFLLMHAPETHMDFDLELAKKRSLENPVYYVQYAYVRAKSIIQKAQELNYRSGSVEALQSFEEIELMRKLAELPDLILELGQSFEVHRLTSYAIELTRAFHGFYEKEQVLLDDRNLAEARLALIFGVRVVLERVLALLGVSRPDKM